MAEDDEVQPYAVYSTPSSTAAYSQQYFHTLTFNGAVDLDYPPGLPPSSLRSFTFCDEEPATAQANLILPGEAVPCLDDLQPLVNQMNEAYNAGKRSVLVRLQVDSNESPQVSMYSFRKVRFLYLYGTRRDAY